MKKIFIATIASLLLFTSCISTQTTATSKLPNDISKATNDSEKYLLTYYPVAVEQMHMHNIPASVTLAQALLEGGAGKSELVQEANNHFGVKADSRWSGKSYTKWDNGKLCEFRVYGSARESYEDHSKFLTGNSRYAFLFELRKTDYKGWAKGLKKAGYAEDKEYPQKLIGIIERYNLQKFDHYSMNDIKDDLQRFSVQEKANGRSIMRTNGLLYIKANEGDTFTSLSRDLNISKRKLRKYNDLYKKYKVKAGDIIYLEKKKNRAAKAHKFHTTEPGESLYDISQKYGVKLKRIYKMNPMYENYATLKVGDIIRLR